MKLVKVSKRKQKRQKVYSFCLTYKYYLSISFKGFITKSRTSING